MEKGKKLYVITGCDSGIGKSLCEKLRRRGYYVCASYLSDTLPKDTKHLFPMKMDLRSSDEIRAFADFVIDKISEGYQFMGLINNAAVALGGPAENLPMTLYRETFEINLFGLIELTKHLIPSLIKAQGRIFNMSSMAGLIAMPFLSPYVASKFALEGFSDSLRRELAPLGVKVIVLEPGGIATPIWSKAKEQDVSFVDEKYMASLKTFEENFIDGGLTGWASDEAATRMVGVIEKRNPRARYIINKPTYSAKLLTFVPQWLFDKVVTRLFKMNYHQ